MKVLGAETHTTVKDMKRRLFGNGQPGELQLIEKEIDNINIKLSKHSLKIQNHDNLSKNIKWAIGAFVTFILTNIGLLVKMFN